MDYLGKLRKEKFYTFPVVSASLLFKDGKFSDEETSDSVINHNFKFGFNDINLMNVPEVTSVASCCFHGAQEVLVKIGNEKKILSFYELDKMNLSPKDYTIFNNGDWNKGKLIKVKSNDLYAIMTKNNKLLMPTGNHIHKTLRGLVQTSDLRKDDYLLFNSIGDKGGKYGTQHSGMDGFYQGAYISDYTSNLYDVHERNSREYMFKNKKQDFTLSLNDSYEYKKALLDGIAYSNDNGIIKAKIRDKKYIPQLEAIATSLGYISEIENDHIIIYIENIGIKNNKNYYKIKDNSYYCKIDTITHVNNDDDYVYCFEMENEPYFTLANGIITHNCRLVNDTKELDENKIFNSIGGSDLNVGSTKVVTINLVRLAILAKGDSNRLLELIKKNVELIHKFHYCHRIILQKLIDKNALPLYTNKMMNLKDQFSTIGINGIYESIKVFNGIRTINGNVSYSEEGLDLAKTVLNTISEANKVTKEKYNFVTNIEQVPAESASIKLNKKDRLFFGNYLINELLGEDCYIYGNQWIPLKENADIFDRIKAAELDEYCGGGAILHINLGENFQTFEQAKAFTLKLANMGVKYFSYISLIDVCKKDHSFFGDTCPICGGKSVSKCIKIVGYLVKQDSYSKERKKELKERKRYNLN